MKNKFLILAVLITIFGFVLRTWQLSHVPPSLNWDEASLGYNAFSILKTGSDEYGMTKFPLVLKSFGDYKPAFYVYLVALSEILFGANEFAVRLPSAFFGSLAILLIYLVVRRLFSDFRGKEFVALFSSFILATSPWHFQFSHSGWEANVLDTFLLLGIWFFLRAVKERPRNFYFAALVFGMCFYLYQGAKMLVPLILLGLIISFQNKLQKVSKKTLLISFLILVGLAAPIYSSMFMGGGGRLKVMSLFSYPRSESEALRIAQEGDTATSSLVYKVFHGPVNFYARGFLGRFLNHFSGRFLFFEGDWSNPRHSVPSSGNLNLMAIILLPLGIFFVSSRKVKNQKLLWLFLLIGPLSAALTRDVVQATRSLFLVYPLSILTAFGVYFILETLKKRPNYFRWPFFIIFGITWLFSFVYFLDQYFVHAPKVYSQYWQYGYKEVVYYIKDKMDDYERIIFTQKYGQPYIYFLFYSQYPPANFQNQADLIENSWGDVGRIEKIDNLYFRDIYWPADRSLKKTLFIGTPLELPKSDIVAGEARILKEVSFLDGTPAFLIVETLNE